MTRKVFLNVAVTITTNDENKYAGAMNSIETRHAKNCLIDNMERIAASHTKNCLLDNPDIEVFNIQDVDVVIEGSEETDPIN